MRELHTSKPFVWGLLLIFLAIWFYALGARTLVPTDEGRYAEMAREMVATGDWITPRLNAIKYFEKPPLQNWMNAITFEVFGLGEWQARLWTGLCGLLGIFLAGYSGRRLFGPRVGFHAALVLGSSMFWMALAHINTLDMGLAGMMTLALCGLLLGQHNDASARERRNWMLVCWAGMALAVMSKGLIGVVLPGAVLVLYTLFSRDWAIWKRLHALPGVLLFLAITVPWFVLVSLKNPEFLRFFFIHEHFQRFTSKIHHRAGPWHYFIPILLLGITPWLGMLFQSLWQARRETVGAGLGSGSGTGAGFQPKMLLLVWSLFILLFFSVSGSKLPSYILPIFPALALLIACYLERASVRAVQFSAALLVLSGIAGIVYMPYIAGLTDVAFEVPLYQAYAPWVGAASALGVAGGAFAIWLARRRMPWALVMLAATGYLSAQLLMLGHEPLGRYAAGVDMVPAIEAELTPQTPIYAVGRYNQTLPFYLRRTMILVEHPDELAFGLEQQPQLWIPTRDAFITQWKAEQANGQKALAILHPDIYADFKQRGVPMRLIAQDPRRVVVANDVGQNNAKP
jgi:4-amino-4-deoxy-L-arabinose transferase-like glycosyltransferase